MEIDHKILAKLYIARVMPGQDIVAESNTSYDP